VVNLNIISIILFPLFAILYMERVYRMTFEMIHEVYAILWTQDKVKNKTNQVKAKQKPPKYTQMYYTFPV
jgi:hypothetical protein